MNNNRICVICEFYSFAVWPAIQLHIRSIINSGEKPLLFVRKENERSISLNFPDCVCVVFENYFTLGMKILKLSSVKYVWCPDLFVILKVYPFVFCAGKMIVFWFQGILPEEHYMKFHNKFKFYILNVLEYIALLVSTKIIVVSDTMKEFLENKYHLRYKKNQFFIIPCISELQYVDGVEKIRNSYVYIGGLSVWQMFDDILKVYHRIQSNEPNSVFHIITLDIDTAQRKVDEIFSDKENIFIYAITDRSEISSLLSKFEYGFLIREKNKVNEVASPIKFAEYLSCGVKPIMTDAIPHLTRLIEKYHCGVIVNDNQLDLSVCKGSKADAIKAYNDYFSLDNILCLYKKMLQL